MLVLSRKLREEIIIDGNIRVVVVSIQGDKVRLGIEAPKNISIHRKEVLAKIPSKPLPGPSLTLVMPEPA